MKPINHLGEEVTARMLCPKEHLTREGFYAKWEVIDPAWARGLFIEAKIPVGTQKIHLRLMSPDEEINNDIQPWYRNYSSIKGENSNTFEYTTDDLEITCPAQLEDELIIKGWKGVFISTNLGKPFGTDLTPKLLITVMRLKRVRETQEV